MFCRVKVYLNDSKLLAYRIVIDKKYSNFEQNFIFIWQHLP